MKHVVVIAPVVLLLLVSLCFSPSELHAQTKEQLRSLYDSIIVDTRAFDSMKERWLVTDPAIVREVFTQLKRRAPTALAAESLRVLITSTESLLMSSSAGDLHIMCRKRYYDDEIELVQFIVESPGSVSALGALRDYVLILDALGQETYDLLKSRRYKDRFETTHGKRYDIFLSPIEPRILLWSTSPTFEWWRISAVGRLGNDYLNLPFWFKSSIIAALELLYIDDVTVTDQTYHKFSITAGLEVVNNFSVLHQDDFSPSSVFKKRILQGSGESFFLKATWTPEKRLNVLTDQPDERIDFTFEASLGFHEKTAYASNVPDTFYSIRNSIIAKASLQNVGLFRLGGGLAWHDLHRFARFNPVTHLPARVGPTETHLLPFIELGIAHDGSLLQFEIMTSVNYSLDDGYGYFGVKSKLILSNMLGLDLRYFRSYRSSHLPPWQYEKYFVPSFVVRINY